MPFLTVLAGEDAPAARRPETTWRPAAKAPLLNMKELWGKLFKPKGVTRAPATSKLQGPGVGARRPAALSSMTGAAVQRHILRR